MAKENWFYADVEEVAVLQERICSKVRTICSVEILRRLNDIVKRICRRGSR